MKLILSAAAVLAATTCATLPAFAADLDVYQEPVYTEVEYGSGWYLRGDIGYATSLDADVSFFADRRYSYRDQSWDDMWSIGGGFGYTFNVPFRADVTVDYFSDLNWQGRSYGDSCNGLNNSGCVALDHAQGDMTTVMANGYLQLGEAAGFSPYISGGMGMAYVNWETLSSDATCYTDAAGEVCPGGTNTTNGNESFSHYDSFEGASSWNFAYSLGAGFQYRLDQNWLLDFGYRYVTVSDGIMVSDSNLNGDIQYDDLSTNEFRVGFRYEIW